MPRQPVPGQRGTRRGRRRGPDARHLRAIGDELAAVGITSTWRRRGRELRRRQPAIVPAARRRLSAGRRARRRRGYRAADRGSRRLRQTLPGHGATEVDSHLGCPCRRDRGTALASELPPFQAHRSRRTVRDDPHIRVPVLTGDLPRRSAPRRSSACSARNSGSPARSCPTRWRCRRERHIGLPEAAVRALVAARPALLRRRTG